MTMGFNTQGKMVRWPLGEWRNADAGLKQLTTDRNADAGLTFSGNLAFTFWFFNIIEQEKHHQQPVQGVPLDTAKSMTCMGYLFTSPAVWTCRVYPKWTCRVHPFPLQAVWTCRKYPFPPPAVWTCRVYPFPSPAYESAGCIHFHRQ